MEVTVATRPRKTITLAVVVPTVFGLTLSACAGAGGGGGSAGGTAGAAQSINVLMVGNPQMEDIQKLTKDSFTKDTGITVNFTVLPENELRDKVTQDIATQAGQYDVATVGAYEVPIWAKLGWLHEVSSYANKDAAFDVSDILKADGPVPVRCGRQPVRDPLLRRVLDVDVPQGRHGGQGDHRSRAADMATGRRYCREG